MGADAAPGTPGPVPAPTTGRVPRVARVLALAHHWQGLIRSGAVGDQADLARLVGVSRARVTQVMSLLHLGPAIQEVVLAGLVPGPGQESALREAASQPIWARQNAVLAAQACRASQP